VSFVHNAVLLSGPANKHLPGGMEIASRIVQSWPFSPTMMRQTGDWMMWVEGRVKREITHKHIYTYIYQYSYSLEIAENRNLFVAEHFWKRLVWLSAHENFIMQNKSKYKDKVR
jgi:hypothetical protein